jgi:alanine-glyoxylate transaminase/serine-glyoxylate transaminase/serine-pyruvate transaminase
MLSQYWGQERVYHHAARINMTYGLYDALAIVLAEGLESGWARDARHHAALKAGLAAIGYAATQGDQLLMLNAGIDE